VPHLDLWPLKPFELLSEHALDGPRLRIRAALRIEAFELVGGGVRDHDESDRERRRRRGIEAEYGIPA
jgi:hypothetical protein